MSLPYKLIKRAELEAFKTLVAQKEKAIERASYFVKEIEKGNLEIEFADDDAEDTDSLHVSLISMRDQLKKISLDEKERNWITEGLAKFADILRKDSDDMHHLANNILINLVKYMHVNQGALFILSEDDADTPYLELYACYAYNRQKYLQKKINIGEGLIGQAFLEKEPIYLTEVPDQYVAITSGLGDAPPKNILIVPLKLNEQVYGLVELASFYLIKPYQQDFVARLGESIASTISSVRVTNRTKILLEESQQQAEEMRAQEEEVRQNMEELSATQEEMQRILKEVQASEQFMNDLLDAYPDTIFTYDKNYTLVNYNKIFENNWSPLGFKIEKGFDVLSIFDSKKKLIHKDLYDRVLRGETFEQLEEIQAGKAIQFYSSVYAPLRNERGEVIGGALFAKDITETETIKRNNEKLLEESQQQTEEMQAQEEELRQNMEVLSATQEEIQRKAAETENRIKAIENSGIASIEFDLKGNILAANDNFLALMGYTLEEIQGKHHQLFVSSEYANSKEYQQFWKELGEGKPQIGEFIRSKKQGEVVYLQGSYSIISDNNGNPLRLLKLATDITNTKMAYQEAQEQAEELQAQAQTLQSNADEFEAMQSELQRMMTDMQAHEHLLKEMLDSSKAGIIAFDKDYKLLSCNKTFETALQSMGLAVEKGLDLVALLVPEEKEATIMLWEKVLKGETSPHNLHLSGLLLEVDLSPLKNAKGNIIGITLCANDTTALTKHKETNVQHKQSKK